MKHLAFAKSVFAPVLILGLVVKAIIFGISIPESLSIGFLTALYGVEVFFYLKRLHKVETRKLNTIQKELSELRSSMSALKIQATRSTLQSTPLGNVSWQNQKP